MDLTGKLLIAMPGMGDARFDKSLTDAFIKLDTLPKPLGKPHQETFLFNLDDLQGQ